MTRQLAIATILASACGRSGPEPTEQPKPPAATMVYDSALFDANQRSTRCDAELARHLHKIPEAAWSDETPIKPANVDDLAPAAAVGYDRASGKVSDVRVPHWMERLHVASHVACEVTAPTSEDLVRAGKTEDEIRAAASALGASPPPEVPALVVTTSGRCQEIGPADTYVNTQYQNEIKVAKKRCTGIAIWFRTADDKIVASAVGHGIVFPGLPDQTTEAEINQGRAYADKNAWEQVDEDQTRVVRSWSPHGGTTE